MLDHGAQGRIAAALALAAMGCSASGETSSGTAGTGGSGGSSSSSSSMSSPSSSSSSSTGGSTSCGDGKVDPGEQCDDTGESATCDADCTSVACGDGVRNVAANEGCDDGNTDDGDACSATCKPAEFAVTGTLPPVDQSGIAAVVAGSGSTFVVAWHEQTASPATSAVWAARYDAVGKLLQAPTKLATGAGYPAIGAASDGHGFVAWTQGAGFTTLASQPFDTGSFGATATQINGSIILPLAVGATSANDLCVLTADSTDASIRCTTGGGGPLGADHTISLERPGDAAFVTQPGTLWAMYNDDLSQELILHALDGAGMTQQNAFPVVQFVNGHPLGGAPTPGGGFGFGFVHQTSGFELTWFEVDTQNSQLSAPMSLGVSSFDAQIVAVPSGRFVHVYRQTTGGCPIFGQLFDASHMPMGNVITLQAPASGGACQRDMRAGVNDEGDVMLTWRRVEGGGLPQAASLHAKIFPGLLAD